MNKQTVKYKSIIKKLIKKSFHILKDRNIFVTETKVLNFEYCAVTNYFVFFSWIAIHPRSGNYSKQALTGLLCHELSHLDIIYEMDFFDKILFALKYVFSKKAKIEFERNADFLSIEKGYGKELIKFKEESWKGLSKKKLDKKFEKGYLSIEDVELSMKDGNNIRN